MRTQKCILIAITIVFCAFLTPNSSKASEDDITLKVVSMFNKEHRGNWGVFKLAEMVEKSSGGRIKIEWAGGPELIKAGRSLDAASVGQIDIAVACAAYFEGVVPEGAVFAYPFGWAFYNEILAGREIYDVLNPIYEKKTGCKILGYASTGIHYIWTTAKPIMSPEDLRGLKIRYGGGSLGIGARIGGASRIQIGTDEFYMAAERGIVEGATRWIFSIREGREFEVLNYCTPIPVATGNVMLFISVNAWDKLGSELQKILMECIRKTEIQTMKRLVEWTREDLDYLQKNGIEFIELSNKQEKEWRKRLREASEQEFLGKCPEVGPKILSIVHPYFLDVDFWE